MLFYFMAELVLSNHIAEQYFVEEYVLTMSGPGYLMSVMVRGGGAPMSPISFRIVLIPFLWHFTPHFTKIVLIIYLQFVLIRITIIYYR